MASDQQVTAQVILRALLDLQRRGNQRIMADLEKLEPELANHLMEELSLIHQKLVETGARAKEVRQLQQRIEGLALICITALRHGHYELWRQSAAGSSLEGIDPIPQPQAPSDPEEDPP